MIPKLESILNKEIQGDLAKNREKLIELINSVTSISSFREDLIFYLKKWVIVDFAFKYNFNKVIFGMNGHKVAT